MKDQIPVMDLPLLGKTKKLPFPATLFTAVIVAVRMFPAFVFFLCIPDYLRVRADQEVIAPTAPASRRRNSLLLHILSNHLQST